MDFEDIKVEFEHLKDSMNKADSAISVLIHDTKGFLGDYCKNCNDDENFIDELSLHLAFLERYSQKNFYFMEYLNNITFFREKQPKSNICYMEDYAKDNGFEEDMYVDANNLPDFCKMCNKPYLRLCEDIPQDENFDSD